MFLKPAEGLTVPDPDLRDFLPAEGRDVVPSQYWTRRMLDGDVVEIDPQAPLVTTDLPPPPPAARAGKQASAAPSSNDQEASQ